MIHLAGLALALHLAPVGWSAAPLSAVPSEHRITGVRVHLFYEASGVLDERDLATGDMVLWNTVIGEGAAVAPSSTSIVYVELEGPSFVAGTAGVLSLTARTAENTLLAQEVDLATFFSQGTTLVIPFVVFGTGCGTLEIDAELTGIPTPSRTQTAVDFQCGE